ncbi:MAG: hypothetical protein U9N55_05270, partial [candidate division Zixibacteria bacterium]|nr:hypothetical protein [candidate division Zixibacteria bacterium]
MTTSHILDHKADNMTLRYAHPNPFNPLYQRETMDRMKIINGHKFVTRHKVDVAQLYSKRYSIMSAGVVELVDTRDLKSLGLK